ncbi:MAG: hypothetical protein IJ634_07795 [Bacteroidales bacterium]|nr:hypothetical protein [Bacteroidales bacterium]
MVKRLSIAWRLWRLRPWWRKALNIATTIFALAGAAIIGAWGLYQLGVTNNRGAVDKNYRSLLEVSEIEELKSSQLSRQELDGEWALQYGRVAALARFYPANARLILTAAQHSDDPNTIDRMLAAARIYIDDPKGLDRLSQRISQIISEVPQQQYGNVIPWMQGVEWPALKQAILRDSALIREAGRLSGVEPRLIVGCLVGEQIRLFNSKREMFKKYLGPVKVLSVQSQFSYGVNGIKDFTAKAVEEHLQDPTSEFYMGPAYEHLLDFATDDHTTERYNRLVDYRNHLYSYLYTGCILHQTMLQWRRAGYDISDRPDVLFTLFNVGFSQSVPKPNPVPGGSHIKVGDDTYTFGALGFDFYYSGEMADVFPFEKERFATNQRPLTPEEVARIQAGVSDCNRPERGLEYRHDSSATSAPQEKPDPFGVNHDEVKPINHTAQ